MPCKDTQNCLTPMRILTGILPPGAGSPCFAGAFPAWLAPVQAMIIPIADRHIEYANQVLGALKAAGIRAEVDAKSERMNAKVLKRPYLRHFWRIKSPAHRA